MHYYAGICVIDLDTVMPGYFISDLGNTVTVYYIYYYYVLLHILYYTTTPYKSIFELYRILCIYDKLYAYSVVSNAYTMYIV